MIPGGQGLNKDRDEWFCEADLQSSGQEGAKLVEQGEDAILGASVWHLSIELVT